MNLFHYLFVPSAALRTGNAGGGGEGVGGKLIALGEK